MTAMGVMLCQACGDEIVRKPHEGPSTYAKRVVCCRACAGALKVKPRGESDEKVCPACSQVFKRNGRQSAVQWKAKVACDQRCTAVMRERLKAEMRELVTSRICEICDREFSRMPGEQYTRFMARAACSPTCVKIHRRQQRATRKIQQTVTAVAVAVTVMTLPSVPRELIEQEMCRRNLRPAAWMYTPDTCGVLPHDVPS